MATTPRRRHCSSCRPVPRTPTDRYVFGSATLLHPFCPQSCLCAVRLSILSTMCLLCAGKRRARPQLRGAGAAAGASQRQECQRTGVGVCSFNSTYRTTCEISNDSSMTTASLSSLTSAIDSPCSGLWWPVTQPFCAVAEAVLRPFSAVHNIYIYQDQSICSCTSAAIVPHNTIRQDYELAIDRNRLEDKESVLTNDVRLHSLQC